MRTASDVTTQVKAIAILCAIVASLVSACSQRAIGGPTTAPVGSPKDPAAQMEALRSENAELREENARLAAMLASLQKTSPNTQAKQDQASTRPSATAPFIEGRWEEAPGISLLIKQSDMDWTAQCSYARDDGSEVQWEMKGTVSADGKVSGVLHHTNAPKGWKLTQNREGNVSSDGNRITGFVDGNQHSPFTWVRNPRNWTPEKNLTVGMSEDAADATMKAGSPPFVFIKTVKEVMGTDKIVVWSRRDTSPRYSPLGGRTNDDLSITPVCNITFTDGKIEDIEY